MEKMTGSGQSIINTRKVETAGDASVAIFRRLSSAPCAAVPILEVTLHAGDLGPPRRWPRVSGVDIGDGGGR